MNERIAEEGAARRYSGGMHLNATTANDQQTKAETPTGIRNPTDPERWLVPPVASDASAHDVVRHSHRFQPALLACAAIQAAYYQGFATVLAATPTADLLGPFSWQWYHSVLASVSRCAETVESDHQATLRQAQQSMQLTHDRALGLNSKLISGQND